MNALPVGALVGKGSTFVGRLEVPGSLRIDGAVRGSIVCGGTVITGRTSRLESDISSESAVICGHVEGDITALGTVRLVSGSIVTGTIVAARIEMEEGALLHGRMRIRGRRSPSSVVLPASGTETVADTAAPAEEH